MPSAGDNGTTRRPRPDEPAPRFFFQHIMKTAGTSFAQHFAGNFAPEEIYPSPQTPAEQRREQYWKIAPVRALGTEGLRGVRMVHGHLPLFVADLVDADISLTILRDPIERTISHMRHCRRHFPQHRGKSLDAIYDDGWLYPLFFRNYQVKQFSLTDADAPKAHNEDIVIDDERLRVAIERLERVDVFGLTDRYDEFVDEVRHRFGWTFRGGRHRLQTSPGPIEISRTLRARIVADNRVDVDFYEYAVDLYRQRASASSGDRTEA